jgi:hypothetical protein
VTGFYNENDDGAGGSGGSGVSSFNTRTGAVVLESADIYSALGFTPGMGTVTSVATDSTLTGGPITTTGTLGINLSNPNTWTATQTFSGATTFSNNLTATTGTISLGTSTGTQIIGIGNSATNSATTKTLNIGTNGVSGSITNITLGSAVSGSTGNLQLNSPTVNVTALTTGGLVKSAATTGLLSNATAGTDYTTPTGTEALSNKTITTSSVNGVTLTTGGGTTTFLNANGTYTTPAGGTGFTWSTVSGTTQSAAINNGYIPTNSSLTTITLPSTAVVGSIVAIAGQGSGSWKVAQNSGQTIHFASQNTTTGTGGSLTTTNQYDSIELICVTANTDWVVRSSVGNIYIN